MNQQICQQSYMCLGFSLQDHICRVYAFEPGSDATFDKNSFFERLILTTDPRQTKNLLAREQSGKSRDPPSAKRRCSMGSRCLTRGFKELCKKPDVLSTPDTVFLWTLSEQERGPPRKEKTYSPEWGLGFIYIYI